MKLSGGSNAARRSQSLRGSGAGVSGPPTSPSSTLSAGEAPLRVAALTAGGGDGREGRAQEASPWPTAVSRGQPLRTPAPGRATYSNLSRASGSVSWASGVRDTEPGPGRVACTLRRGGPGSSRARSAHKGRTTRSRRTAGTRRLSQAAGRPARASAGPRPAPRPRGAGGRGRRARRAREGGTRRGRWASRPAERGDERARRKTKASPRNPLTRATGAKRRLPFLAGPPRLHAPARTRTHRPSAPQPPVRSDSASFSALGQLHARLRMRAPTPRPCR